VVSLWATYIVPASPGLDRILYGSRLFYLLVILLVFFVPFSIFLLFLGLFMEFGVIRRLEFCGFWVWDLGVRSLFGFLFLKF
jgi:hypothetical protein